MKSGSCQQLEAGGCVPMIVSPSSEMCIVVVELVEFLYVSVAVPGLGEGLSTVRTGVGPLSCMDSHVHVELVSTDEALVAAGAGMRLVPRVVALMHLQLCLPPIGAPTLRTLELRPHFHVLSAVKLQTATGTEALGALVTLEGFEASVDVDVELETSGRGEAITTNGTEVGPLTSVNAHVLLQLVLVQEASGTDWTVSRLLSLMLAHVFCQL